MNKLFSLFLLFITVSLSSQTLESVYVLSEGGFSAGTSRLSMFDNINKNFTSDILTPSQLGLYPDGIVFENDTLYVLEQGSFGGPGKIYAVNPEGGLFDKPAVEVGTNPFSLAISNNKIYITNGPVSTVSVLNKSDFSLIKDLNVGVYPQEILASGNYVFVANNSQWGGDSDSTVTVIDSRTDEIVKNITVKKDPSSLAISNDGNLIIGCPGDQIAAMLFIVDITTLDKIDSMLIPTVGFGKDLVVDTESSNLYFIDYLNNVSSFDMGSKQSEIIIPADFGGGAYHYGYNYDSYSATHFLTNALDFAVEGILNIYDKDGNKTDSYTTGIAPRRIVLTYSNTTDIDNRTESISGYKLGQNYPNPFNPTTKIEYAVGQIINLSKEEQHVSLKVYNTLGEEIATLVNSSMPAGEYSIEFNANSLPSGIYIYKLIAGNYTATRKMLLLK